MRVLIILTGLFFFVIAGCTHERTNHNITGFWQLADFEVLDSNSEWKPYPWNKGGTGYLMYDGRGHAALHISPKNYSEFRWRGKSKIDSMGISELQSALGMLADNYNYMARYDIDSVRKIVSHHRLSHSRPEDWGKTVERRYEFYGPDTLILYPVEGDQPRRLTWIRVIDWDHKKGGGI